MRSLKSFIRSTILVHLDSEVEPRIRICVRRPPSGHSCEGRRDSAVQTSTKLNYNGFGVGVPRVFDEISERVEIVVDQTFTLKVCRSFQGIHGGGFSIEWEEVLLELFFEVDPVDETKVSGLRFRFELASRPAIGASGLHVRHRPDNLRFVVFEGFGA